MLTTLILDDNELTLKRPHIRTDNVDEFKQLVCEQEYSEIWLDHDLGRDRGTGLDAVDYLVNAEHLNQNTPIVVTTMNPVAGDNMVRRLRVYGFKVKRIPIYLLCERL